MAKYTVTHTCGHEQVHQLIGPNKSRESKLNWLGKSLCSTCYQAKLAADRLEASKVAAESNAAAGLVALTGSDNQIAWAETIRKPVIAALDALPTTLNPALSTAAQSEVSDAIALVVSEARGQSSAKWWIDNQDQRVVTNTRAWVADQLLSRLAILAPTAHAELEVIKAAKAAEAKAAQDAKDAEAAAAKAREDAANAERWDRETREVAKAATFRVSDWPAAVKFTGREDFLVCSTDGRTAKGALMDGDWAVYQIGGIAVSSRHPEMERIAREARAQWERQQAGAAGGSAVPTGVTGPQLTLFPA